ncbi:MAG: hypothetical protein RTU30_15385, partial [Candidatus Thorarchaeota archaeon]
SPLPLPLGSGPYQLSIFSPCVTALDDAGFMYSATFSFSMYFAAGVITDNAFFWTFHDIVYGINQQSDWTMNHLRDVVDLDVGDTDSDGRREVVVGFDNQVGVYEMKHSTNGTGFMSHEEVWLSNPFENPVTGVTVHDMNNNGWEEIGISTERGDVYIWEYIDPSEGAVNLMFSEQIWTTPTAGDMTYTITSDLMDSFDFDMDGYDEIIVAHPNEKSVLALDHDGSPRWEFTDSQEGFNYMLLEDIVGDSLPEVLCAGNDSMFYVLDIQDGTVVWQYNHTYYVWHLTVGDVTGDGIPEVVFSDTFGNIVVLDANGTLIQSNNFSPDPIYYPIVGNFTEAPDIQLAFVSLSGEVMVVNPLNGSVYYQSPTFTASITSNILAHDFNEDGFDDIVYTWYNIHILDVNASSVYYNSSYIGIMNEIAIADFDGDNVTEILTHTYYGGVYLEEVKSGVTQWRYDLSHLWPTGMLVALWDMDVGNIGGSGPLDITVAGGLYDTTSGLPVPMDVSVAIAIDGKNGVPVWFNYSDGVYTEITTALLPESEYDCIVAWDFMNEKITAVMGVEPSPFIPEPAYDDHEIYYDMEIRGIYEVRVDDIQQNNIDEIFAFQRTNTGYSLLMIDAPTQEILWNRSFDSKIQGFQAGFVSDPDAKDVVVWVGLDHVFVLDGYTGQELLSLTSPNDHEFRGIRVADFNDDAGDTIEEIAVLVRQWTGGSDVFIEWYDVQGNLLYDTTADGFTATTTSMRMAVGNYRGYSNNDIILGGSTFNIRVYNGETGAYGGGASIQCYGFATGDFNGDGFDDIAVLDGDSDVHLIEWIGGGGVTFSYLTGAVRAIRAADLFANGGRDEIVIYLDRYGVFAYDWSQNEVWRYNAPLVLGGKDTRIAIADMNNDGREDVVLTNKEYINVIDGVTARVLWHYWKGDLGTNSNPRVGRFYANDGRDVLSFGTNYMYIVAHDNPAPPIGLYIEVATETSLFENMVVASLLGVPMLLIALVVPIRLYRRREE